MSAPAKPKAKAKKGKPEAPAAEASLPPIPPPPDGGWPVEEIPLDQLKLDDRLQSRWEDWETKGSYTEAMTDGAAFPPVEVVRDAEGVNWVWDGFHRLEAAQAAKLAVFKARVQPGDFRLAQRLSLSANATHGLPRKNQDKRRTVERALKDPEWSKLPSRALGELCGVSHEFVARFRREQKQAEERLAAAARQAFEDESDDDSEDGPGIAPGRRGSELPESTRAAIAEHRLELQPWHLHDLAKYPVDRQAAIVARMARDKITSTWAANERIAKEERAAAFRETLAEWDPDGARWGIVEDLEEIESHAIRIAWIEARQDLRPDPPGGDWDAIRNQPIYQALSAAQEADYTIVAAKIEDLPGLFNADEQTLFASAINARDDGVKGLTFLCQGSGATTPLERFLGPIQAVLALAGDRDVVLLCGHTSVEGALDLLREGRDVLLWHPDEETRQRLRDQLVSRSRKGVA